MPGVLRLLQHFRRHQIRMALVTGTHGEYIPMKLKGHPYVLDFFEQWVGGDEVEKGKPSPESFLKAASKMNVEPTECIVFEDSVTGVKVRPLCFTIEMDGSGWLGCWNGSSSCTFCS